MVKILIAYYSRTGNTRKVAEALKAGLDCDIEEIVSIKKRTGLMGYLFSGKEGTSRTPAEIGPAVKNPADYDMVIIGTPVWVNISSPVRAYLMQNAGKFKKIACFCTMGSQGAEKVFREIEGICKVKSIANLSVLAKDSGNCEGAVREFIKQISK